MTLVLSLALLVIAAFPALPEAVTSYGANAAVGRTFHHDGIPFYFEVYGTGEPLLLVHGNGGSIADFRAQIDYFRPNYQVIAMDSRAQGKSGDSPGEITYQKMAGDLAALLDHLGVGPVNVLGWSDGGIEGLLLGIHYPAKVKKLVAMAPNLNPSDRAIYPEVISTVQSMIKAMPPSEKATPQGKRLLKVTQIMFTQPYIEPKALNAIAAPTLLVIGDHDLIREEHALLMYRNIPNSELCILPDATHMVPFDDPALFNSVVDRFFHANYRKKDRMKDLFSSLEAMHQTH
jgi:pimeloyl-ACP methyl ester carboxylesterase